MQKWLSPLILVSALAFAPMAHGRDATYREKSEALPAALTPYRTAQGDNSFRLISRPSRGGLSSVVEVQLDEGGKWASGRIVFLKYLGLEKGWAVSGEMPFSMQHESFENMLTSITNDYHQHTLWLKKLEGQRHDGNQVVCSDGTSYELEFTRFGERIATEYHPCADPHFARIVDGINEMVSGQMARYLGNAKG